MSKTQILDQKSKMSPANMRSMLRDTLPGVSDKAIFWAGTGLTALTIVSFAFFAEDLILFVLVGYLIFIMDRQK